MNEEEDLDGKADWLRHDYTQALLKSARAQKQKALEGLIMAARRSVDPAIVVAYAKYEHHSRMCQMFEGKSGKEADGEV